MACWRVEARGENVFRAGDSPGVQVVLRGPSRLFWGLCKVRAIFMITRRWFFAFCTHILSQVHSGVFQMCDLTTASITDRYKNPVFY